MMLLPCKTLMFMRSLLTPPLLFNKSSNLFSVLTLKLFYNICNHKKVIRKNKKRETLNSKQYGIRPTFYYFVKKWPINRDHQASSTAVTMNNTKLYMWLPTDDIGFEFFSY